MVKVVGYRYEGDIWCPSCMEKIAEEKGFKQPFEDISEINAIFDIDESDRLQICNGCKDFVESEIISKEGLLDIIKIWVRGDLFDDKEDYSSISLDSYTLEIGKGIVDHNIFDLEFILEDNNNNWVNGGTFDKEDISSEIDAIFEQISFEELSFDYWNIFN